MVLRSVLQCVAVCCSVLQYVSSVFSVLLFFLIFFAACGPEACGFFLRCVCVYVCVCVCVCVKGNESVSERKRGSESVFVP